MRRGVVIFVSAVAIALCSVYITSKTTLAQGPIVWPQWGQNPQHTGAVGIEGQRIDRILADLVYDPFVAQEQAEADGDLLVHYQVPLIDGEDVFMAFKTGSYISCTPPGRPDLTPFPCGPDAWTSQIFNQRRLRWENGQLVTKWNFETDWKPMPAAFVGGWEPVYHAALANGFVYDPGAAGTIFKLNRETGAVLKQINPFGSGENALNTFASGPPTADNQGNIYYNVLKIDPRTLDTLNSWLVKVAPNDNVSKAEYVSLLSSVNPPTLCTDRFRNDVLPWPPEPTAKPAQVPCGPQRPGVNVAPAISPDGKTIYTISVADNVDRYAYVVAVDSNDLSLKWAASMRDRIADGCGVLLKIGGPGGCNEGTPPNGVDPQTNELPAGRVIDPSSSSPAVAPDGSVLYGAYSRYNYARGHLFKFSSTGQFVAAYDFGWDSTPAIYAHDGTHSVVIKDNHYVAGSYCGVPAFCPVDQDGSYHVTQLDANLKPEWKFTNTNTLSCVRNPDGTMSCISDHPNSFEWCINAPAIDGRGVVYANSEDGNLYAINQGGTVKQNTFLKIAIGAAYTPLSIGQDGRIYTENDGHLFVLGR